LTRKTSSGEFKGQRRLRAVCTPTILALRRQKDQKFEARLDHKEALFQEKVREVYL
jgi:hypothetical protein